jgi:hypothetical protein
VPRFQQDGAAPRMQDVSRASYCGCLPARRARIVVVALVTAAGCAAPSPQTRVFKRGIVRESRVSALYALQSEAEADPIEACDKILLEAIRSRRFGSSGVVRDRAGAQWDELAVLRDMRKFSCDCKKEMNQGSYVEPADVDTLAERSISDLVAVAFSLNQSPTVREAVHQILEPRLQAAGPDDLATLYAGDWHNQGGDGGKAVKPEQKFKARRVECAKNSQQ